MFGGTNTIAGQMAKEAREVFEDNERIRLEQVEREDRFLNILERYVVVQEELLKLQKSK